MDLPDRRHGAHAHPADAGLALGRAVARAPGRDQPGQEVIVVCDRWSAYKALARRSPGRIVLQYCWAHQRRDFRKVGTGFPDLKPWADVWLDRIGAVFHLAQRRRQAWQPGLPLDGQDTTFRSRQEQLQAAFDGLFQTAREELLELRVPWILELNRPHPHGGELARLEARSAPLLSLLEHREGLKGWCPQRHRDRAGWRRPLTLGEPHPSRSTSFPAGRPRGPGSRPCPMPDTFGSSAWRH